MPSPKKQKEDRVFEIFEISGTKGLFGSSGRSQRKCGSSLAAGAGWPSVRSNPVGLSDYSLRLRRLLLRSLSRRPVQSSRPFPDFFLYHLGLCFTYYNKGTNLREQTPIFGFLRKSAVLTICPETITTLIRFQILRCKNTLRHQQLILQRHKSPEVTAQKSFQSPVRITAPRNNSKTISEM